MLFSFEFSTSICFKDFVQDIRPMSEGRLGVRGDKSVDSRAKLHRRRRMDAPDFIPLFGL